MILGKCYYVTFDLCCRKFVCLSSVCLFIVCLSLVSNALPRGLQFLAFFASSNTLEIWEVCIEILGKILGDSRSSCKLNVREYEKVAFSTNISLYFENDTISRWNAESTNLKLIFLLIKCSFLAAV